MNEEWRAIKDFEGFYEVSNLGRVRTLDRRVRHSHGGLMKVKGKMLKLLQAGEYLKVCLNKDGKTRQLYVHRLVAKAFLTSDVGDREVNHKNGAKHDNKAANLEWVTRSENAKHAYATGLCRKQHRYGERNNNAKLNEGIVRYIRWIYKVGGTSQRALGEMFDVSCGTITGIINHKTWKYI